MAYETSISVSKVRLVSPEQLVVTMKINDELRAEYLFDIPQTKDHHVRFLFHLFRNALCVDARKELKVLWNRALKSLTKKKEEKFQGTFDHPRIRGALMDMLSMWSCSVKEDTFNVNFFFRSNNWKEVNTDYEAAYAMFFCQKVVRDVSISKEALVDCGRRNVNKPSKKSNKNKFWYCDAPRRTKSSRKRPSRKSCK